jgi:dTDP-4-amino-4,6-dideoxygalactose transaminase
MVAVAPSAEARERAARVLADAGIQTGRHYPAVPDLCAFACFDTSEIARSRAFSQRAITLPLHPRLDSEAVREICATLARSARACG